MIALKVYQKYIVNNFLIAYVGENKVIPKVKRNDVLFHARRGLAEMSYDALRSEKSHACCEQILKSSCGSALYQNT